MERVFSMLESAAGRSHARSSIHGKDMRVIPDRMSDGRHKRRKSEREQDDGSKTKEPFVAAERRLVPLSDIMEGFGFDVMPARMGIHGVGTSPSASGDPHGRERFKAHVPVGKAKVAAGDPLAKPPAKPKRGRKKRRRK